MRNIFFIILFNLSPLVFGQCLIGDCFDGEGEYKYKNGTYSGTFSKSRLNGTGTFVTKRGYSYSGDWALGSKHGEGEETFRKGFYYRGAFEDNLRHGFGAAKFSDTRFMQEISYRGEWAYGNMCGSGAMVFTREVKYGRVKTKEQNRLEGDFINGVFQGRLTSPYLDEHSWSSMVNLRSSDFQFYQNLSKKEEKRLKNPAYIEGEVVLSCECNSGLLVFDADAILRKEMSWLLSSVPSKTKEIILNTRQREFDIIEWHSREIELELNKKGLPCDRSSINYVWEALLLKNKECMQIRKEYNMETAWNPARGGLKNTAVQAKWNKKIDNKLRKLKRANKKQTENFNKKINTIQIDTCLKEVVSLELVPESIIKEIYLSDNEQNNKDKKAARLEKKEDKKTKRTSKKEDRIRKRKSRTFPPNFPRKKQLE